MSSELMWHFESQGKTRTERTGLRRLLEFPLRTPIGYKLLKDFAESNGKMSYHSGPIILRGRPVLGDYEPHTHHIRLSSLTNGATTVHEAAHARQLEIIPDLMTMEASPVSLAQISMILEADSWALTSIYMKQIFAEHIDDIDMLDRFMRKERGTLKQYVSVDPFILERGDKPQSSTASTLKSMLAALKNRREGYRASDKLETFIEKLLSQLKDPAHDHAWAAETFRVHMRVVDWTQSNAMRYVRNVIGDFYRDLFERAKTEGLSESFLESAKKEVCPDKLKDGIMKLADLSDLGIEGSYILPEHAQDMNWCTVPHPVVYREHEDIKQWVKQFIAGSMMPATLDGGAPTP